MQVAEKFQGIKERVTGSNPFSDENLTRFSMFYAGIMATAPGGYLTTPIHEAGHFIAFQLAFFEKLGKFANCMIRFDGFPDPMYGATFSCNPSPEDHLSHLANTIGYLSGHGLSLFIGTMLLSVGATKLLTSEKRTSQIAGSLAIGAGIGMTLNSLLHLSHELTSRSDLFGASNHLHALIGSPITIESLVSCFQFAPIPLILAMVTISLLADRHNQQQSSI